MHADTSMPVGIFYSEGTRIYDSVRLKHGFAYHMMKTAVQRVFPGLMPSGVRGNVVAADTLVKALVLEGTAPYEILVDASRQGTTERQIGLHTLPEKRREQISVRSIAEVASRHRNGQRLRALFNPFPSPSYREGGVEMMQALRQCQNSKICPVTFLTHGLSGTDELYSYFLRILLEGTHECDSIICATPTSREAMRKIIAHVEEEFLRSWGCSIKYQGRIDLLPLCVETGTFGTPSKEHARKLLGLSRKHTIILMLGRLSPLKADLYPFLPVLKSLDDRNANRHLLWLIAGTEDAGYTQLLRQRAQALGLTQQMKVLLDITDQTKSLLLQASDIFMSPTDCISESFGLTVIEAMAAGVPQVVSDWNGYRDTVRHGETGFLVPTRWMNCCDDLMHIGSIRGEAFAAFAVGQSVAVDMAEMEKYLHLLINNAQLRNEMSERSRNRALALFSFGVVAKQYDELWTELTRAANSIHAQPTPMNFARPAYHQFFGHYASKPLSEDTLIELSATANSDDGGVKCLPEYPGALANLQALDEDVFARIFELFKSCNAIEPPTVELHSPVRMGDLVETLRRSCSYHPDCLRRHIMWLIKFGFVNALGGKQRNERPRC